VASLTGRLQQRETELGAMLADALTGRAEIENRLADTVAARQQSDQRSAAELAGAAGQIAALEARVSEEAGARAELEERLFAAESARLEADRQHAIELASESGRLAEVQAQHEAVLGQRADIERALVAAGAALEETRNAWQSDVSAAAGRYATLEGQLEASGRDNARLLQDAEGLRRQLDVMRTRADSLRRQAAQVPALQGQLEASLKENRRQFERAPYGLAECSRDGSIIRVNHSFVRVLGYRSSADLQDIDLAEGVFESAADLRWLLERVLQTGEVESFETTLRTRDLRRLSVRLHAHSREGSVAIAVEDLTALHDVEQRLRDAHRLEAVGRVASEVAATCDTMLRDVSQGGQQWLAALEEDTRLRQQGELLLGDVTRAAGFLRQFVVYGHQQISNVASVNLVRALRDLSPVLKRVLGDDIVLLLPRTTGRFEIDVDAARVERILVNVANYARQRMPHGGRVKMRLATAVVDRQFVASHPKVRPGTHALMTIEEIQGPVWPSLPVQLASGQAPHPDVPLSTLDRPGMDLGPLVALIGEVGGHLWISAERAGNMTLQIHLPKRIEDESLEPVAALSGRARQLARWFRH
jgi:PAS domain S-box-containing protein